MSTWIKWKFLLRNSIAVGLFTFSADAQEAPPKKLDCPPERVGQSLESIEAAPVSQPSSAPSEPSEETRSAIAQIRTWLEDRRFEEADRKLRQLLATPEGQCYDALLLSAQIRTRVGQLDEALAQAQAALDLRPKSIEARLLIAELLANAEQPDMAMRQLRRVTLLGEDELGNPAVTLAWFQLGEILAASGYCSAAVSAYERFDDAIWDLSPEHANAPAIKLILAREPKGAFERRLSLLTKLENTAARLRLTRAAGERWPKDIQIARAHINALLAADRAVDAFDFARSWVTNPGGGVGFLREAVKSAVAAGKLNSWLESVEKSVQEGTSEPWMRELPAALLVESPAAADRLGTTIMDKGEFAADLPWIIASARLGTDKPESALAVLAKLAKENPSREPLGSSVEAWCSAVSKRGDFETWSKSIREKRELDFSENYVLGVTAAGIGRPVLAEDFLNAALAARPDFSPALAAKGRLLLDRYEWEEARIYAQKILTASPNLAAAWFLIAQAADGLDEIEKAEEAFRKAIKAAPDEPSYKITFAQHCRRVGDRITAQRYYAEALAVAPEDSEANEGLIEVYVQDNKLSMVREHFEKIQAMNLPADVQRRIGTTIRHLEDMWSPAHISDLKSQYEANPSDLATAKILCAAMLQNGETEEARRIALRAMENAPRDYQLTFLVGNLHMRMAEFDRAVESFDGLAKRYPNRAVVLDRLAAASQAEFSFDRSESLLQTLQARTGEKWNRYSLELLIQYDQLGQFDKALKLLEQGLAARPDDQDLLRQKARVFFSADRKEEGTAVIAGILDKQAQLSPQTDEWIRFALEKGAYIAAEAAVRKWLANAAPGSPENMATVGLLVRVLCDAKKGDAALTVAREFKPGNAREAFLRRVWLGDAQQAAGHPDKAIAEYEALLSEPFGGLQERVGLQRKIIVVLLESEQFDRALEQCEKYMKLAAEKQPEAEELFVSLQGDIFQAAGREREYSQILERAFRNAPNSPGLNNDLAYTWVESGRNFDQALKMSRFAVAEEPLNAAYLDTLGWIYYKLGQFENAAKWQLRAVQLRNGHDADQFDHLGDIQWRLNRREEAAAAWKKAVDYLEKETERERRRAGRSIFRDQLLAKIAAVEKGGGVVTASTAAELAGPK